MFASVLSAPHLTLCHSCWQASSKPLCNLLALAIANQVVLIYKVESLHANKFLMQALLRNVVQLPRAQLGVQVSGELRLAHTRSDELRLAPHALSPGWHVFYL